MLVEIISTRDGKTRQMEKRYADILVLLGHARYIEAASSEPVKRGPGRPPGSPNKPKDTA